MRRLLGTIRRKLPEANTMAAIATVVAALATAGLWLATRNLVATARDTEIRQLRAYVYVGGSSMKGDWEDQPDGSSTFTLSPAIHILGVTPIADIRAMFYLKLLSAPPPKQFSIPVYGAGNLVEAPGEDYPINREIITITPADKDMLRKGTKELIGYGRVEYADVFAKARWTEFCWQFVWANTGQPKNVFPCPYHNDADWSGNLEGSGHHPPAPGAETTIRFVVQALRSPGTTAVPPSPQPRGFGVPHPTR